MIQMNSVSDMNKSNNNNEWVDVQLDENDTKFEEQHENEKLSRFTFLNNCVNCSCFIRALSCLQIVLLATIANVLRIAAGSIHIIANDKSYIINNNTSEDYGSSSSNDTGNNYTDERDTTMALVMNFILASFLLSSEILDYYNGVINGYIFVVVIHGALFIGCASVLLSKLQYHAYEFEINAVLSGAFLVVGGILLASGHGYSAFLKLVQTSRVKSYSTASSSSLSSPSLSYSSSISTKLFLFSKLLTTIGSILYMSTGICLISALYDWSLPLISITASFFISGGSLGVVSTLIDCMKGRTNGRVQSEGEELEKEEDHVQGRPSISIA